MLVSHRAYGGRTGMFNGAKAFGPYSAQSEQDGFRDTTTSRNDMASAS